MKSISQFQTLYFLLFWISWKKKQRKLINRKRIVTRGNKSTLLISSLCDWDARKPKFNNCKQHAVFRVSLKKKKKKAARNDIKFWGFWDTCVNVRACVYVCAWTRVLLLNPGIHDAKDHVSHVIKLWLRYYGNVNDNDEQRW